MKYSVGVVALVVAELLMTPVTAAQVTYSSEPQNVAPAMPSSPFRDCPECPEMAVIPEGEFLIGSLESEAGRDPDESPVLPIKFRRFAVGTREVSIAEWNDCVLAGGCFAVVAPPTDVNVETPVTGVSWASAIQYVQWLSKKTRLPYRLLTEVEWEYAARAGKRQAFSSGATIDPEVAQYAWNFSYNRSRRAVAPSGPTHVAAYAPNDWGLYDMHGNVWEWTADCYSEVYSSGWSEGTPEVNRCTRRVIRGGGWNTGPRALRSANREWESPDRRDSAIGFRVSRSLDN